MANFISSVERVNLIKSLSQLLVNNLDPKIQLYILVTCIRQLHAQGYEFISVLNIVEEVDLFCVTIHQINIDTLISNTILHLQQFPNSSSDMEIILKGYPDGTANFKFQSFQSASYSLEDIKC